MGYEKIDSIITKWAKSHGLHLYKNDRDSEVRTTEIVDQKGRRYQIWINAPDINGIVGVHVWDYKRRGRRRDFHVSSGDLREYLENALEIAKKWSLS